MSNYWTNIVSAMNAINNAGYEYRALSQNSNAVVDRALNDAGLPSPEMDGALEASGLKEERCN